MGPTIGCPRCGTRITPEEIMAGISPTCCAGPPAARPRRPTGGTAQRVRDRVRRLTSAAGAFLPVPA